MAIQYRMKGKVKMANLNMDNLHIDEVFTNGRGVGIFGSYEGRGCLITMGWGVNAGEVFFLCGGEFQSLPMSDDWRALVKRYAPAWRG